MARDVWRHPADSSCTLSPSSSSHQVPINSLDPSHQGNPMSPAPLAPVYFVSIQIACLGPKGGPFLHLPLHLSFSQEVPLQLFQRILQTLKPSVGNTEGPQQECRPGHGAWGTAEERGMGAAGPVAQTGSLYWASPFAEESGQLPPSSLKALGTPGWGSLGDEKRGRASDVHCEPWSLQPRILGMPRSSVTTYRRKACAHTETPRAALKVHLEACLWEDPLYWAAGDESLCRQSRQSFYLTGSFLVFP